jgi:choline dehydrogenase
VEAWEDSCKSTLLKIKTKANNWRNLETIDDSSSTRSYAATAYYAPNVNRPNLTVLTEAQVNKIVLSKAHGSVRATSVSFTSKGSTYNVKASKEVLLCAGAFQSPQILELSGIGSKEILTPLEIPVVVENPNVGENLQDQPFVPLSWETEDGVLTLDSLQVPGAVDAVLAQFYSSQSGLLVSFIQSSAYLSFEQIRGETSKLAIHESSTPPKYKTPSLHKQFELQKASLEDPLDTTAMLILLEEGLPLPVPAGQTSTPAPGSFLSASAILCHPFSRGSVHIASNDPTAKPLIDYDYLSNPLDLKILEDTVFFMQDLATKEPLASVLKDGGKAFYPGYSHQTKDTIEAWCKATLNTSDHPMGSCSMLPKDEGGVVDDRLKVYDVENLRVVDASIFPMTIRSNPVTTVYAVAEKAAVMIRDYWSAVKFQEGEWKGHKRGASGEGVNGKGSGKRSKRG